jgi:hypothetical protein
MRALRGWAATHAAHPRDDERLYVVADWRRAFPDGFSRLAAGRLCEK